ncbi:MAG: heat-inducible transcriptional repressor HrcA [Candidatus Aminicenantia bacterium]
MLDKRAEVILKLIIESYLKEGTPVSSQSIARELGYSLSPATIRNVMAKLEREDFLFQPHISAGRIPTDKGLKFYAENILEEMKRPQEVGEILINTYPSELAMLLEKASKFLSETSDCMSFIVEPPIEFINFNYINLEKISNETILLTLLSSSNLIVTKVFKNTEAFTQDELSKLSSFLQERFAGQNLETVKSTILDEIKRERKSLSRIIEKFIGFFHKIEEEREDKIDVHIQGHKNLIGKPEFPDLEALKNLLKSLEEKSALLKLLQQISLSGTKVVFSSEIGFSPLISCSFIVSGLKIGNNISGSIGIIGSRRMLYKVNIPLVDGTAKFLSQIFS